MILVSWSWIKAWSNLGLWHHQNLYTYIHINDLIHANRQERERERERERETRLRTTHYSLGTNCGSLSDRNHLSHKTIGQHNDYSYNHPTFITNNLSRVEHPRIQTTTRTNKITIYKYITVCKFTNPIYNCRSSQSIDLTIQ